MKLKRRYKPMLIVLDFSIRMLFVAFILSLLKHIWDGNSLSELLKAPIFMFIIANIMGFIYCEVKYWIGNIWLGSFLFGIFSSNLFLLSLPLDKLVHEGNLGKLPELKMYLSLMLFLGILLSIIYFQVQKKKF